jgi:translation initiation factor IF-2
MQQRRLRLGDILDDYCPRERRITNHAVVAMIEDTVKQTRCTTCDAEHEYKQAKVPAARRRKTGTPAAQLVEGASRPPEMQESLSDAPDADELPELPIIAEELPAIAHDPVSAEQGDVAAAPLPAPEAEPAPVEETESNPERDEWPVHRPLIRATLPRPEGHVPERKAPDFTFRPAGGKFDRNGQRHRGRGQRPGQGQSSPGQGQRFGGQRPAGQGQRGQGQGGPQGQRQGDRSGQGGSGRPGQGRGPRPGGGRKRGR